MTSRERITAALNYRQPDKTPIDFGGHRSSGIAVQAYAKLRRYLGLPRGNLYVYDMIQQLALVEKDVLDIVGADVVGLSFNYLDKPEYWKDWVMDDGTPVKIPAFIDVRKTAAGNEICVDGISVCIQKKGTLYFEQTVFPYADSDDNVFDDLQGKLRRIMWCSIGIPPAPAGFDAEGLKIMENNAKELRGKSDRAIYGTFGGNLMEIGQFAFRIDNFLCELLAEPNRVHRFLDKLTDMHMGNLEKFLGAVGNYIDIIGFGDDLGMKTGPQVSVGVYNEFFKPRHKKMWKRVKELCPHLKIGLHCCGGVYPLLPHLIEAGLDAINPVQLNCAGMEPERLKREFAGKLTLWGGGCDTSHILPAGTVSQIAEHTKKNVEILNKGGGFIFQQVHNILAGVPPENVMAMFNAANTVE